MEVTGKEVAAMFQTILQILLTLAVIAIVVSLWRAGRPVEARVEIENDEDKYIEIRRN
jgi:hypothetical protein